MWQGEGLEVDFFGIGFAEILLILVVILVIWGPGRIVEISLKLGKIARTLRKATFDLTTQVTKELESAIEKPASPAAEEKQPANQRGNTKRET